MIRLMSRAALPLSALALALVGTAATSSAADKDTKNDANKNDSGTTMTISSPKFGNNEEIPQLYTCKGSNLSPPLTFSGIPTKAKSVALLVEDPDASYANQGGGFAHWVVYDMPVSSKGIKEGARTTADLPKGAREGLNDAQRQGWTAPCPPSGTHHYVFKLFALDSKIDRQGVTKVELEDAMRGHVIAQAELTGTVPHR
jgi:Raf kinase inhibitor-like YbhB/YbcL family protein